MSIPSEQGRRTAAALVRAIDVDPDATSPGTLAAIRAFVDDLVDERVLPEGTVIAFKRALSRSASLNGLDAEAREHLRSALVSACIEHYFAARAADDAQVSNESPLRLVRNDDPTEWRAPGAST
jgi:hypothetical protein